MSKVEVSYNEDRQLLEYYQNKVDELYKQRLAWLSKFDQCNSQLTHKHKLMDQLKDHKDKQMDVYRSIIRHDIALLDQKINVTKMQRENISNEYLDAEQILKMEELMEEYPQQLQKHLPCKIFGTDSEVINNELNIHNIKNGKMGNKKNGPACIFRESNSVLSNGGKFKDVKIKYKPTYEQLLKRQIAEIKTNQGKQLCLMQQQARKLQETIKKIKSKEEATLNKQREIVDQLRNEQKKQEEIHRNVAEKYFAARKRIKDQHQATLKENLDLRSTLTSLEQKVNEQMKTYQKENKAKQTLIVRKSQDFQQDYKARMRAKQHNLQALRDNYEKMQDLCIQKIKKLEDTLIQARQNLKETEIRRDHVVGELKSSLSELEKKVQEQKLQRARVEGQIREKYQNQKQKRAEIQEKEQEERRKFEKARLIQNAYKKKDPNAKTMKPKSGIKKQNNHKKQAQNEQSEQDSNEQSMAMSDLQNIRQQINKLSNKIQKQNGGKKLK